MPFSARTDGTVGPERSVTSILTPGPESMAVTMIAWPRRRQPLYRTLLVTSSLVSRTAVSAQG